MAVTQRLARWCSQARGSLTGTVACVPGCASRAHCVHEFGVRIALGAGTRDVLGVVLAGAARMTLAGAAIGMAAAPLVGRSIAALLFDVTPLDLFTFGLTALVVCATATLTSAAPAWRATQVDPAAAFRQQ
jgi:putative ABC transport system permease protein